MTWTSATTTTATITSGTGWRQRPGGSRDEQHHGGAERSDVPGGCADGDGGDAGIDRGNADESIDRQGEHAAVHGDGNLFGYDDGEHHEHGDVGVGDHYDRDYHGGRAGGVATGVGVGTSNITASLGGVTSPVDVLTVTAATMQSIAVTPANPSIVKGGTQQFTATGTYSDSSTTQTSRAR